MEISRTIFEFVNQYLSKELAVVITSMLPLVEVRGAIPLARALGMSAGTAYGVSVIGNIIPVVPLLFLLNPVTDFLCRHFNVFRRFFDWLHERTLKKSDKVEKYGALGLVLFTAIPLPTTGAWTACVAAILFRIPFKYAFPAIVSGVLLAGVLMTLISYGVF